MWGPMCCTVVDVNLHVHLPCRRASGSLLLKEFVLAFSSVQEKQPFMTKAVQKKSEYDKTLASYKKKQVRWVARDVDFFVGTGVVFF